MPYPQRPMQRFRTFQPNYVGGEGPKPADIMVVGERPGKVESQIGRPFAGPSGTELTRFLEIGRIDRRDCWVTNLVKVGKAGDKAPTEEEIREWEGELMEELIVVDPSLVIAMGATAASWFMDEPVDMEKCHGFEYPSRFRLAYDGPVRISYHPAYALHDPDMQGVILADWEKEDWTPPKDIEPYRRYYSGGGRMPLMDGIAAMDTEGSAKNPWGMSWTSMPGFSEVFKKDWITESYRDWEKLDTVVVLHNSLHDLPVLRALGVRIGRFDDTMVKSYVLRLLPQGLKPLAYRLAGMEMQSYEDVMAVPNHRMAVDYLRKLVQPEYKWPEVGPQLVLGKSGEYKLKRPWPIRKRVEKVLLDLEKNPNTDVRRRWKDIEPDLRDPILDVLGDMPEATLDDLDDPAVAVDYAGRDADATLRINGVLDRMIDEKGVRAVYEMDMGVIPLVDHMMTVGMHTNPEHFRLLSLRMDRDMVGIQTRIREMTGVLMNPASPDQTRDLLFNRLGLTPKKLTKSGLDWSTDDKVLESMAGVHPVVRLLADYRERKKIKTSFCDVLIRKAVADLEHRIRGQIKATRVSSGRLAMADPNLMAQPVRSELGKELREGFEALPGWVLLEVDKDQIEMRWMAWRAEEPRLIDLFRRGIDVHSQTASWMFGIPIDRVDPLLHRYAAKRIGFGVITGITGHGLVAQMDLAGANEDGRWTEDSCDQAIEDYFKVYPGIRGFMQAKREEARRYGYVRDYWGRLRYLGGIHSTVKRVRAEAERQAHSHDIQAGAQGDMKRTMRRLWEWMGRWWGEGMKVECWLQVHDSLLFHMPEEEVEIVRPVVMGEFCESGPPEMTVPITAKSKLGRTWGECD